MTREKIKELLPIMQAFAEGKEIQVKGINNWRTSEDLNFDLSPEEYRIKAEPKYRPFKSQEECWNEMHKHPDFGFIKEKGTKVIYSIAMIDNFYLSTHDRSEHLGDTLAFFEFTDGTPFSIKEE